MNTSHAPLLAGMVIGFSVAVPIGPMGLLCIQRTLASGMRVGWFTGLGAATVNAFYGTAIIFGFGQLGPLLAQGSRVLSALGGLFLLWSAMARIAPLTVLTTGVGVLSAVSRKAAPRLTRAAGPLALNAGWVAYYAWRLSGTGKR